MRCHIEYDKHGIKHSVKKRKYKDVCIEEKWNEKVVARGDVADKTKRAKQSHHIQV